MAATAEKLKKVTASMMNAIHDLPLLVARDEGFFRDEGLDVEVLKTPGTGQHGSSAVAGGGHSAASGARRRVQRRILVQDRALQLP